MRNIQSKNATPIQKKTFLFPGSFRVIMCVHFFAQKVLFDLEGNEQNGFKMRQIGINEVKGEETESNKIGKSDGWASDGKNKESFFYPKRKIHQTLLESLPPENLN